MYHRLSRASRQLGWRSWWWEWRILWRCRIQNHCEPLDISHLDTHMPTTRLHAVSVTSGLADSDLQSALAESQRLITKLKDIVVKKFIDDKPDNPRLDFCDFLKVELVQLTSDSNDEFQQETFNLLMRLKPRDKQQQRYQHEHGPDRHLQPGLDITPLPCGPNTQMQAPHQQMQQTFTHVPQGLPQQQHLQHSQQHFQQIFTQPHAPAQQQIHGHAPQQSMQAQQHLQVMSATQQTMQQQAFQLHQSHQAIQQQQQPILTHQPIQQENIHSSSSSINKLSKVHSSSPHNNTFSKPHCNKCHREPLHHSCMSCRYLLQCHTLDAKAAHHSPAHQQDSPLTTNESTLS